MLASSAGKAPTRLQSTLLIGVALNMLLIAYGVWLIPATSWRSLGAALGILAIYGLAIWWGVPRIKQRQPAVLPLAVGFGLAGGIVFVVEIVLEYLVLPRDNTIWGYIEFGIVFGCYLVAGFWTVARTRRVSDGVVGSVGAAMVASLIWMICILVCFYLFFDTPQQVQVFRAEGNYDDFLRSGMHDFHTFVMEDFLEPRFPSAARPHPRRHPGRVRRPRRQGDPVDRPPHPELRVGPPHTARAVCGRPSLVVPWLRCQHDLHALVLLVHEDVDSPSAHRRAACRWVMTKLGSISPFWMRSSSGCM